MRAIENIFWLGTKEIRSFMRDFVLLGLVTYAFSLAIMAQARSYSQELHNASVGWSTRINPDYRGGSPVLFCRRTFSGHGLLVNKTSSR